MSNLGGGEMLAVLLLALIVLGPERLPKVARQAGAVMRQLRQMSSGFQEELRSAFDDPQPHGAHSRTRPPADASAPLESTATPAAGSGDRRLSAVPDHEAPLPPELAEEVVATAEPARPGVDDSTAPAATGVPGPPADVDASDEPPAGGARAAG